MFSSSENEKKKSFFKMGNCYINGVNPFKIQSLFEYFNRNLFCYGWL